MKSFKFIAISLGFLLGVPSFILASGEFVASEAVIISDINFGANKVTLTILGGSSADSIFYSEGKLSITNPGTGSVPGTFKVAATHTSVKSIGIRQNKKIIVCAENITPGASFVSLPLEAGEYFVEPFSTKNCQGEVISPISIDPLEEEKVTSQLEVKEIKNSDFYNRLKGNILLKVEDAGKAYYVHPSSNKSYYLGKPADAFTVMREQGVGISNINIKKIPVGIGELSGLDTDGDGLSDIFEDALGTDKTKVDSDGDGYTDKIEIMNGYNPLGTGKSVTDSGFSNNQKGRIVIQVEGKGEAWYINPDNNRRYFLGRPADAFEIMKKAGMGISNKDFNTLN